MLMMNHRVIVTRYGGPEVLKVIEEPLRIEDKRYFMHRCCRIIQKCELRNVM